MNRPTRYPQEVRERAVRMVFEHRNEHRSQWATICSIAEKFGMSAETLRSWVRRAEIDGGIRPGMDAEEGMALIRAHALHPRGFSGPVQARPGRKPTPAR